MADTISVIQGANHFLPLGWNDRSVPVIDQMKLQKLLFYAHAWHLALRGEPLFEEEFEAWPWGPVAKVVYFQTRNYGRSEVTGLLKGPVRTATGSYVLDVPQIPSQLDETKTFIDSVWESHKRFSGIQLSNTTHLPGEPWTIVRDLYGSLDAKPLIPNGLIKDVFKRKASASTQHPASASA